MKLDRKWIGYISVLAIAFALSACGSSKKEAAAPPPVGIATVGIGTCYNCHSDSRNPSGLIKPFGDVTGVGWVNSMHANFANTPSYADIDNNAFCISCHDQLGDGRSIDNLVAAGITNLGDSRPVVGCESCHGPGGNHYGIGPMPFPTPDASRCGQCHTSKFPHTDVRPEGISIYEDYSASKHAHSIVPPNLVANSTTDVRMPCGRCHTDEGARRYITLISGTESYGVIENTLGGEPPIPNASVVQCRTCHDAHQVGNVILGDLSSAPDTWTDTFRTCTSCHQLYTAAPTPPGGTPTLNEQAFHDPSVNRFGVMNEIITDTHYDLPNTPQRNPVTTALIANTGGIEGYIVDPTCDHSEDPQNNNCGNCLDCHNQHAASVTINREWASSAHAGHLFQAKEAAGENRAAAFAANTVEAPWAEYDFKNIAPGTSADRSICQRCHTATGFRNMANKAATGGIYCGASDNAPNNPNGTGFRAVGEQAELLYCWACHQTNNGVIRNPGQFSTADLVDSSGNTTYVLPPGRSFPIINTPASLQGSFVCLNCHSGRETGEYVKSLPFATIANSTFGNLNSHYLAAGGIMFRTIGYEFAGRSYDNVSAFIHNSIGTDVLPGIGENGPCASCHMLTGLDHPSHLFLATTEDSSGNVTAINSQAVCNNCHGKTTSTMDAPTLTLLNSQYDAALNAIAAQLALKGIYFCSSYPYFFTTPACPNTSANAFAAWPNIDTVGAAFNLNVLEHMPGAFVHNNFYTRYLIYDSIDFLDDGLLNCSVESTLGNSGPAYDFLKGVRTCP